MSGFQGFPAQTLPFLDELARHNDRAWFAQHKHRYEAHVRDPALDFIEEMAPRLKSLSAQFSAIAKKSGGSLMRVYRDARFSKDKSPYKTNIGIQFRHVLGKDIHAPGFYLHIAPGDCFLAAGIWHPEPKTLARIRAFIVDNPAAWRSALAYGPFQKHFRLAGDSLQRPPKGFLSDHPLIEDLKRKDFIAVRAFDPAAIQSPEFTTFVASGFKDAAPLVRYLCTAIEVNF